MARSLAFPLRLGGRALVTNEQDSDADVADGIALALAWPRGTKRRAPGYGRPPIEFERVDTVALARAIEESEPRSHDHAELVSEVAGREIVRLSYEARG